MSAEAAISCMARGEWSEAFRLWQQISDIGTLAVEHIHAYAKACEVLEQWGVHEVLLADACRAYPRSEELKVRARFGRAIADLNAKRWKEAAEKLDALRVSAKLMPWPVALRYYRRQAELGLLLEGVTDSTCVLQILTQRQLFKYPRPYPPEQLAGIDRAVEALPWPEEFKTSFLNNLEELIRFVRSRDEDFLLIREEHFESLIDRFASFVRKHPHSVSGLPAPYCAFFFRLLIMFGHYDVYYLFRRNFAISLADVKSTRLVDFIYRLTLANEKGDYAEFSRLMDDKISPIRSAAPHLFNRSTLYFGRYNGSIPNDANDYEFAKYLEGKSVAIVGPTRVGLVSGSEIDSFDVVVRFNHRDSLAYDSKYFGTKTNCSYYIRLKNDECLKRSVEKLDFLMFEVCEFPLPDNVKARRRIEAFSYLASPFLCDMPNSVPQALMDILRFSPSCVKIFNVNLFVSLDYISGYFHSGEVGRPMAVHDPVSNFIFMQRLYSNQLFEADRALEDILKMSVDQYVSALNNAYGKEKNLIRVDAHD